MKKSIKLEYIILSIVILFSIIYLLLKDNNRVNYTLPNVVKIENDKIDKIEIVKKDSSIIITKEGSEWKVGKAEYKAGKTIVKNMLEKISNLKPVTLVSKTKNYTLYELNETKKINVKAYLGNKVVRDFNIGKVASTYDHTFITLKGDPNVYQAKGSLQSDFKKNIDDIRDKTVLSVNKNLVKKILIQKDNKQYVITKNIKKIEQKENKEADKDPKPVKTEIEWKFNDKIISSDKINPLLNRFVSLDCFKYLYEKDKNEFDLIKPIYTITLEADKNYTLKFFQRKEKDKGEYPAFSSESKWFFLINSYSAKEIMKTPEELSK